MYPRPRVSHIPIVARHRHQFDYLNTWLICQIEEKLIVDRFYACYKYTYKTVNKLSFKNTYSVRRTYYTTYHCGEIYRARDGSRALRALYCDRSPCPTTGFEHAQRHRRRHAGAVAVPRPWFRRARVVYRSAGGRKQTAWNPAASRESPSFQLKHAHANSISRVVPSTARLTFMYVQWRHVTSPL